MNRGAILIAKSIGYLLEGLALKAHGTRLLSPLVTLPKKQQKGGMPCYWTPPCS
jgi:hypothetical protein